MEGTGEITNTGNGAIFKELVRPALRLDLTAYTTPPEVSEEPELPAAPDGQAEEAPAPETQEETAAETPVEPEEEKPEEPVVEIPEDAEVGDVITFGRYEQDNDPDDGTEPIDWQVLAVENSRALVISLRILDAMPYHDAAGSVSWEKSSLRAWLNGEFLESAFNDAEKEYIRKTGISNPKNPIFETAGGSDTRDSLFLLSVSEAEKYFETDEERAGEASLYAAENGAFTDSATGNSWWWLRTPGQKNSDAAEVGVAGWILERGTFADNAAVGVRPAFWLSLTEEDVQKANDGYAVVSVSNDVGTLLRRGPGFSEEILRSILNGTSVELLDETRSVNGTDWVRIRTMEGHTGWTPASSIMPD